jgi:hypothetical protein
MTDGEFFWSSLSEAGALAITAIAKCMMRMFDNENRDAFYKSITLKETAAVLNRIGVIRKDADSRPALMPYVKSALHVFETEAISILKLTQHLRCPTAEPCSVKDTFVPVSDFETHVVPLLDDATNTQNHMQELPSTPTLLLVPSYEWYGLALLHCSGATERLKKEDFWSCRDVDAQKQKDLNAKAEAMLRSSLDRRAGRAVSIFYLAFALEAQGKNEEALRIYKIFLERMRLATEDVKIAHARTFVKAAGESAFRQDQAMPDPLIGVTVAEGGNPFDQSASIVVVVLVAAIILVALGLAVVATYGQKISCAGGYARMEA